MASPGVLAVLRGQRDYFPGATFGADFRAGRYKLGRRQYRHPSAIPGWSFTRASTGYAETSAGALVPFASGAPRITDRGLLVEQASTNLLLRSQEFDNASWTKTDITVTANDATAPDGTLTADLITQGSAGTAAVAQAVSATADLVHAASRFFKYAGSRWVVLRFRSGANVVAGWFDLLNGVVGAAAGAGTGTSVTSSMTALTGGWYRCRVSGNVGSGATSLTVEDFAASADASTARLSGATYHEWGAQFENNLPFATSYIPTTTASATRAADVPLVSGLTLAAPLSMLTEFVRTGDTGTTTAVAQIDAGVDNADCLLNYISGSDLGKAFVAVGSVTQADSGPGWAAAVGATSKIAGRYQTNNTMGARDGSVGTNDTSCTMPTGLTTVRLGTRAAGALQLNGYLRRAAIYPYAMTNAQLQAVTT